MSQVTSPIFLDSTGQDIVTQLATISAALAAGNVVTGNTDTTLSGVLQGANGKVAVKPVDASPTADSTNLVSSGGTDKAIKGRAPVYGLGKNLLRNWDFHVNQRGMRGNATSYSYTVDGWYRGAGNGTCTINNDDTITLESSGGYVPLMQNIDLDVIEALVGKRVTVSVLLQSGELIVSTLPLLANRENLRYISTSSYIGVDTRTPNHRCYLLADGGDSYTIQCIKLELGTEQTLCHNEGTDANPVWVLNEIPDYEYELYRCMTSTADSSDTYANKTLATGEELAYVENGTTASRAYAAGEYFCWHGLLYRAKTAIGNGDTFTVNTNCEVVPAGLANEVIQQTVDTAAGTVNPDITARVLGTLTKIGKTATINIVIEIKPGATVTTNEFYTLPAGFRPKNTLYCGGVLGENPFTIFMAIRSDGQIIQSTWSSRYFSSYQWIVLNGTFLTE